MPEPTHKAGQVEMFRSNGVSLLGFVLLLANLQIECILSISGWLFLVSKIEDIEITKAVLVFNQVLVRPVKLKKN